MVVVVVVVGGGGGGGTSEMPTPQAGEGQHLPFKQVREVSG